MVAEDKQVIRKIVSRLCFMRSDLEAIEKLDIKTQEIKQILNGIKSRVELLLSMVFPARK